MIKFRIFCNFEQEEQWLAEMAGQGFLLKGYCASGIYTFAKGTPQTLHYKIDCKMFSRKSDYVSYLALFEDAGWQHVCGTEGSRNQYFLAKDSRAGEEIFSDRESADTRYKALLQACLLNFSLWAIYCIALLLVNHFQFSVFLTPGLWEKTGAAFWRSFLFELPFAAGRVGIWLLLLGLGILYGCWAVKAKKEYNSHRKREELK